MKKLFYELEGLKSKKGKVKALFIKNLHYFDTRLRLYSVLTAANSSGAFNIWKGDDGFFYCEAFRDCVIVEKADFKTAEECKSFAAKWFKLIK